MTWLVTLTIFPLLAMAIELSRGVMPLWVFPAKFVPTCGNTEVVFSPMALLLLTSLSILFSLAVFRLSRYAWSGTGCSASPIFLVKIGFQFRSTLCRFDEPPQETG